MVYISGRPLNITTNINEDNQTFNITDSFEFVLFACIYVSLFHLGFGICEFSTYSLHLSSIDLASVVRCTEGISVIGIVFLIITSSNNSPAVVIQSSIRLLEFGK